MGRGGKDQRQEADVRAMSQQYWSQKKPAAEIDVQLIEKIYSDHLRGCSDSGRFLSFEISHYLENLLWPAFIPTSSKSHVLSIVLMVNTKFIERVPAWNTFEQEPDHFPALFSQVSHLMLQDDISIRERISLLIFWSHAIGSIERDLVRKEVQKYIALPIWVSLSEKRRESEFSAAPKLKKIWARIEKNDKKLDPNQLQKVMFERTFMVSIIKKCMTIMHSIPGAEDCPSLEQKHFHEIALVERFIQLLVDIEALLPTRRWFNAILDDMHVVVSCRRSALFHRPADGRLFSQLLDMLVFYARFEIDDLTGEALTQKEMTIRHYDRVFELQKIVFKDFPDEMRKYYMSHISAIDSHDDILKHFEQLSHQQLIQLCLKIGLIEDDSNAPEKSILLEMLAFVYEKYTSQLQTMNEMPLYPTETIIWDENIVPQEFSGGDQCLALPKLNLQFLTLHDYLMRNFHLFRLESTYEIRQDIEDAVYRMKPWKKEDGGALFGGWARMALQIHSLTITEVRKPLIGERHPSRVRAEIRVNLNVRREVKREWENLRKHDVCFLVAVKPPHKPNTFFKFNEPFIPQVGLEHVRGCEIEGMLDPSGKLIDELSNEKPHFDTDNRTFRVWLDCNQYGHDVEASSDQSADDFYSNFNLIVRRKPEENNFKAVLETIRDLMNARCVVPEWLHDVILGFGDPDAAHYSKISTALTLIDFNDTFLDFDHLKSSFPSFEVESNHPSPTPPFKIEFKEGNKLAIHPYVIPNRGPYPSTQPKTNSIRFTPTQVEAIRSGVQPGLTVIVGPPGTGKTDVAVQIINNIYHNFPEQRTLIVTHSNQALNQLFEKIMKLDIDERHLLRLGHGEEALETEKDFTRYGRVNFVLRKRLELLQEVQRLAVSLKQPPDAGHTCETASYFFLYHVYSRWEEFRCRVTATSTPADVATHFPFTEFFSNAPQPLFKGSSLEEDLEISRGCYRHIKKIFAQLNEFQAFEILRTGSERSRYLLIREAKVIAMTCTHAALKRKELVELGFQYDNILMEEAAQILEIETFIPLLLQNPEHGHNRLKRWIMIGDHHQLPPVIKNMAFQKFCNMEQSLFTRFVRLGVPTIDLDAQGRARSTICDLFRWRYDNLGDLHHVQQEAEFQKANAGFAHEYQMIDVEDFNGVGESEPVPHFFQNLAEAEFVVATFMYMRLLGYPAEKITILTTYNGQKSLIKDVVTQRCASNPFIGEPHKISTVDKFQGQQNDYILLSLVRTKNVGHIRDVRRLVVALSRARLGLYVFGRVPLFRRCYELAPALELLLKRPQSLMLLPTEEYGAQRTVTEIPHGQSISTMQQMVEFVFKLYGEKIEEWKKTRPEMIASVLNPQQEKTTEEPANAAIEAVDSGDTDVPESQPMEELGFEPLGDDDQGDQDPEPEVMDQDYE